jgi:hypothetical protein
LVEAAIGYVRRKWPVVPLGERTKKPRIEQGWQDKPLRDEESVTVYWQTVNLNSNIGLLLGPTSGLIDIECDNPEAEKEYQELWQGEPPVVPTWKSGRGYHRLFRWRPGLLAKTVFHAGDIEVRVGNGGGAQSVLPPSIHPSGAKYEWIVSPDEAEPGELPDEVAERLCELGGGDKEAALAPTDVDHQEAIDAIELPIGERKRQWQKYLAGVPGTQQGTGADKAVAGLTMKALWGFALPTDTVLETLSTWGQRDDQIDEHGGWYPWTQTDIERKIQWCLRQAYQGIVGDKLSGNDVELASLEEQADKIVQHGRLDAGSDDWCADLYREVSQQAEAASQPKSTRRCAYSLSELAKLPPTKWHVAGLFPQGALVLLFGKPGSAKSFLAIDWALCTATGKKFLDEYDVVQGPVLYVAAEGVSGIRKRCLRWLEHYRLPEPTNFMVVPDAFNLVDATEASELIGIAKESLDAPPALIVLDTLNRNMVGNENDSTDMGAFIRSATALQKAFGCTVIIVHHSGHANLERERGHSSLQGAMDAIIATEKLGERITDGVEVSCKKLKEADLFEPFKVHCRIVGQGDESSVILAGKYHAWETRWTNLDEEGRELFSRLVATFNKDAFRHKDAMETSGIDKSKFERRLKKLRDFQMIRQNSDGSYYIDPDAYAYHLTLGY